MIRRATFLLLIATAAPLVASTVDAMASGPGIFRSRNSRPAATRTYRSYSVSPGNAAIPEEIAASDDAPATWDRPAATSSDRPAAASPRPSKASKSKPSYMRADSKAMGRFGQ